MVGRYEYINNIIRPTKYSMALNEHKVLATGIKHAVAACIDSGYTVPLEGHDGHIMTLVREFLLMPPDAAQHLIHTGKGIVVDGRNAPALVQDNCRCS